MTFVKVPELVAFTRNVLSQRGMRTEHVDIVADSLVYADRRGITTHGVSRLTTYLGRVDAGVMALDPDMTWHTLRPAALLLNAHNGFGQVAGTLAMRRATELATTYGVGVVAVSQSNHFGVTAYFTEMAAGQGQVGLVLTNASPAMAPYNGTTALLGTNPVAIAVPREGHEPVSLDMSSSLVSRGKIRRAHLEGKTAIPEGWAVGPDGQPTTDPGTALEGMLFPIAGPKGAGLSLMVDLLTGVLSGTGLTGQVTNVTDTSRPSGTGHLVVAIDPAAFGPVERFRGDVEASVGQIEAMPSADGRALLLPGQLEMQRAVLADRDGIELPADVVKELRDLAATADLTAVFA